MIAAAGEARARDADRIAERRLRLIGLRRRTKVLLVVATLITSVALLMGYLYLRYVDVVRYSAALGRVTVYRAGLGTLGNALVTNKGFALYISRRIAPAMSPR